MKIVEFFGVKIKPKITYGKKMWNPIKNEKIDDFIFCIKDKDVNCFIIKTNEGYIAIDSGYKNSASLQKGLDLYNIDANKVTDVFLTHLDIDHAGGIDKNSRNIFPNAKIYLSKEEEKYIKGKYFRKKILFAKCRCPITLREKYKIVIDKETYNINGVSINCIFTPGHTLGHMSYLINDSYLFVGDSIISNGKCGYSFYDFWNTDTNMNMNSLKKLKEISDEKRIKYVITSHSGYLEAKDAFLHIDETPNWKEKNFIFIKGAEDNLYFE